VHTTGDKVNLDPMIGDQKNSHGPTSAPKWTRKSKTEQASRERGKHLSGEKRLQARNTPGEHIGQLNKEDKILPWRPSGKHKNINTLAAVLTRGTQRTVHQESQLPISTHRKMGRHKAKINFSLRLTKTQLIYITTEVIALPPSFDY
jgi:hypothetical protein